MYDTEEDCGGFALIADDDEFFRSGIRAILTNKLGFSGVVEVSSFDEVVEFLGDSSRAEPVSLAFCDLSMPGISNPSNLRSLRQIMPDLPIIVVSASERRSDILTSLEAGVHGYVPKRLGIRELERAVRSVLGGDMHVPAVLADIPPAGEDVGISGTDVRRTIDQLSDLTPRQRDVLELIVAGQSNKEIARALKLGEGTVKVHMAALFRNLGVNNRTAAAAAAAPILRRHPAWGQHRSAPGQ